MKKSCTGKESKVISTTGAEYGLNDFREASKELLSEEQLLINKKLLESGIEDENLGWLEKRNIYRTIAASLDSRDNEGQQHKSPRITKAHPKWLVNSFENKNDKISNDQENQNTCQNARAGSPILSIQTKKANQGGEELKPASNTKTQVKNTVEKQPKNAENILKSSKKVHFIKVELEGDSKQRCQSSNEPQAKNQALKTNKKRASCATTGEASKKLKMEETNNGISSEEDTPLKIELEMEKRKQNVPFKLRDIKSILEECEVRNEKWKETYLKNPVPARWGTPIVKNCEKWDGKQIPQKLLHRYQKYLSSNNLTHPVFYPVKSQTSDDLNEAGSEMGSQSLTGVSIECKDESDVDSGERSFTNESNGTLENNLAASTSGDTTGRMVLRSRNQQKPIILDEEEYSSDEFDDWCSKQKPMKKKKTSGKNKKVLSDQNNKQLFLKLEKCNINKRNGGETGRKNGNKNDGFTGSSLQSSNPVNQDCKPGPDPDTMVCPICSLRFKKQLIESHATECASKTYKD